jgi:hypothetical protein
MGKKSRRKAKLRAAGKLAPRVPLERIASTAPAISSAQASRYQYIIPELRLIAIISGALFLILFILAFVLS